MAKFTVDSEYKGYVYVGNACGRFDTGRSEVIDGQAVPVKTPYANMYVLSPTSDFESDDYKGTGLKAEKYKCISSDVWANLQIGEQVQLFFDDKKRVQMAVSVAAMNQFKSPAGKTQGEKA